MKGVLVGSDPEIFLKKDNAPLMALDLIGGTKSEPRKLSVGAVQEDNVAAEFNIPPQNTPEGWVNVHKEMLRAIEELVKPIGAELAIQPVMHFTKEQLMSDPRAMVMGCERDYNIYEGDSPPPNGRTTLRTGAGHIHVGAAIAQQRGKSLVHSMDAVLGVPARQFDKDWEERTKMYGGLGKYRPKKYGIEYRALSNFWLKSDELMTWAYEKTIEAIERIDYFAEINIDDVINNPSEHGVQML